MNRTWTLTEKVAATGVACLVLALASIALTFWVTWNIEGGAAAVNEAGRMRMQTYRLALSRTRQMPAAEARALAAGFDASLELLRAGDPSRPLFVPWSAATRARFAEVRAEWQALRPRWLAAPDPVALPAEADAFVARIDRLVAAIETEIAYWTAILRAFQLAMMALAIASALVLLFAAHKLVLDPLGRLQRGLSAVQQGDFATRVAPGGKDEFGALAAGFNAMADTLQSLYGSLEQKVRDKTALLERKRQRLADLYQVSAFVAGAPTLAVLAQGFCAHVRRIAQADAASVRWCDEANGRYMLLAHERLPDAIAQGEACLEAASCRCGPLAAQAGGLHVIRVTREAPLPLDHCSRAGFATVVSIPVRLHDRMLAEVNLFFRAERVLPEDERELLDTLASHLGSAMEGLRAAAMEREGAVVEERGLIARELHDSIAQSLAFTKMQVQLLRGAMQRDDQPGVQRILDEVDAGVRESYADVRELLLHFRTRIGEADMVAALRTTLQKFEHQTGVPAQLAVDGHGIPPAPDVQVQALHILQEALSNVRKHAGATRVDLRVSAAPHWRFEVRDDGRGFDPADPHRDGTHVGLRIMQERAGRIGATLQVRSAPGSGSSVVLELPSPARALPAAAAAEALA
ncbi:MAG: type IV pili methyl-accepting chemotaxis transducer N-terminal domain-containing protein [Ramlibacter sp.]